MPDRELTRDSKRAFRAVMREMNSSVRFDTPEELQVLRTNFTTARRRSLLGLVTGAAAFGLGWRYAIGRRYSPLATAWGALVGMTVGMFSVRQKMFLELLCIPEDRSPFAHHARKVIEKEMPTSPLLSEIHRRRRELFPRADDSYEEVIWTETSPSSALEEGFPGDRGEGCGPRRINTMAAPRLDNNDWTRDPAETSDDAATFNDQTKKRKTPSSWDELHHRTSRGF